MKTAIVVVALWLGLAPAEAGCFLFFCHPAHHHHHHRHKHAAVVIIKKKTVVIHKNVIVKVPQEKKPLLW